jgi:hypothetical protein
MKNLLKFTCPMSGSRVRGRHNRLMEHNKVLRVLFAAASMKLDRIILPTENCVVLIKWYR